MTVETEHEYAPASEGSHASRPLEIGLALVALGFSAAYYIMARRIPLRQEAGAGQIDARFWPELLGILGIAVSLVLLVIAISREPSSRADVEPQQPGGLTRLLITCLITALFIVLWSVGSIAMFGYRIKLFPILAALFVFILMLLYGHRKPKSLIIYPLSISALIYVLFGILLRVPL
ncbi:Tripartite tricarboxylate transporter TctB family protein [Ruaniaceae bacterium KH17]|nr:Tripartite tricarboxylate transporter TctB family protein [Ruaniaceae bacterium KH17]